MEQKKRRVVSYENMDEVLSAAFIPLPPNRLPSLPPQSLFPFDG